MSGYLYHADTLQIKQENSRWNYSDFFIGEITARVAAELIVFNYLVSPKPSAEN